MKFFLFLLAMSFTASSLLPGSSSIRTHLDNIMDSSTIFNVQQYGATADGNTENSQVRFTDINELKWIVTLVVYVCCYVVLTIWFVLCYIQAFIAAWNAACSSAQSSTVYIPKGTFLVAPVSFAGPCQNAEITVQVRC